MSSCSTAAIARRWPRLGLGFDEIDAVAATAGPGLIGGLIVGVTTGKAIALALGLPFIAVNHLEAHALTAGLTDGLDFPYLLLLVSGGHTQLLIVKDVGHYERLGTTLDDALGEAFDKAAKLLGLDYPGGPEVEECAKRGRATIALPRPMLGRAEPHFSLAGLKTALRHAAMKRAPLSEQDVADLCASFQEAVADIVSDRTARAIELYAERSATRRSASWWSPAGSPPISVCRPRSRRSPRARLPPGSCRRPSSAPTMPP